MSTKPSVQPTDHLTQIVWFVRADAALIESTPSPRRRVKLPMWAHVWAKRNGQIMSVTQFVPPKEIHIVMSSVRVQDSQPDFQVHAVFQDATGATTLPDDVPAWASSAENVVAISSTTADGTSATLRVSGGIGVAEITCTSTDTDGTKIVLTGTVEVTAGEAVRGELAFDLPGAVNDPASPAPAPVVEPPVTPAL